MIADLSFSHANIEFMSCQKSKGSIVVVVGIVVVDVVDVVDVVVVDVVDVVVVDEIVVDVVVDLIVVDFFVVVVLDNLVVEVYNLNANYKTITQINTGWSEAESFSIQV